ncbi:MAG: hypothetical protein OEZ36_09050, partial [Spirochaetota bacterium]|nr:hypothetical protein [Spirochaetota bacterium]
YGDILYSLMLSFGISSLDTQHGVAFGGGVEYYVFSIGKADEVLKAIGEQKDKHRPKFFIGVSYHMALVNQTQMFISPYIGFRI